MIELPNEKVLRNLPEQVAKNVSDIAKLFELIAQVPIAVNFYTKQETNEKFVAEVTDLDSTLISLYNKFGSNAFIVKGADTAYLFFLWPNEGEFNIGYRDLITGEIVTGSDYSETSTLDDVISNAGNTILAIDNYNAAKTYNIGNVVYYQDKLYVCVMPNTSGTLPTDYTKWVTLNGLYIIELQPSVTSGNLNTTSLSKLNNFDVVLYKDSRYYYKESQSSDSFTFVSYYSYVSGSYGGRFLEVKSISVTISTGSWVLWDTDYPMLPLRDTHTQFGGQRLKLNSNLMPEWADPELPSAAAASAGDVLVLNGGKEPTWGSLPSLYSHVITMYSSDGILAMNIINKSSTQFTKTSLINYLKTTYGRFPINGNYRIAGGNFIPSYIILNSNNVLCLIGIDNSGNTHSADSNIVNFETYITGISDSNFNDDITQCY